MSTAIGVQRDYNAADLRAHARRFGGPDQVRRLLAKVQILHSGGIERRQLQPFGEIRNRLFLSLASFRTRGLTSA